MRGRGDDWRLAAACVGGHLRGACLPCEAVFGKSKFAAGAGAFGDVARLAAADDGKEHLRG